MSHRAISSYRVQKAISFLQEPLLETRVNSKYQSKGRIYTLHLLSFVVIRLFNVFLWERKTGFGKKLCGMRDADAGCGYFDVLWHLTGVRYICCLLSLSAFYIKKLKCAEAQPAKAWPNRYRNRLPETEICNILEKHSNFCKDHRDRIEVTDPLDPKTLPLLISRNGYPSS